MFEFKVEDKTYQIKYCYSAVANSGIIKDIIAMAESEDNFANAIDYLMKLVPKMLLVGLQRFHKDEFGYKYTDKEDEVKVLDKVTEILDRYFDDEEGADFNSLFNSLQEEMLSNGFLSSLLQNEEQKTKKTSNRSNKK